MAISQQYIKLNKTVNPLIYRGGESIYGSPDHKLYLPVNDLYHNKQFLLNIFFCNGLLEKKRLSTFSKEEHLHFYMTLHNRELCYSTLFVSMSFIYWKNIQQGWNYGGVPLIFAETGVRLLFLQRHGAWLCVGF